jgi:hypothetical protein
LGAPKLAHWPSSGAITTNTWAKRGTARRASKVCKTKARPAKAVYCLGCAVPALEPVPAQGTKA